MKSEECNGWGDVTPIGAHWYISDYSLTKLFDDGSLCEDDACEGTCNICLGDGSYVFRVTGPTFNETLESIWWEHHNGTDNGDHSVLDEHRFQSWEFCHSRGSYNEQLNFHVKKGKCIPDDLRWADELCDAAESSEVTLTGVIALGGISSEIFSTRDSSLVLASLSNVIEGWQVANMNVLSTSLDTRALSSSHRALNSFTHDVSFSASFVAEDYGIDGATYANVENLVNDMAATIEASFASGAFSTQLSGSAQLSGASLLSEVTSAELLSLEISKIAYAHSRLVYYYDQEEATVSSSSSSSSSSLSSSVVMVLVGVAVVGFVAFVGVAAHGFNGYNKLSTVTDSEHIAAVEMEAAIRSPFRHDAHKGKYQPAGFQAKI